MKEVIIFDLWGTLVENGIWSPVKQVKKTLKIDLPFPEYIVRFERVFMTKEFDSLKEGFTAVCEEFDVEADEDKIEKLVGLWNKNWLLAEPYDDTKSVLKDLQSDYKLVLISNTDSFSVTSVLEKFDLEDYFDHIQLSYDVGLLKADEEFYEKIFQEMGVGPEDCVAVGDSIKSDIAGAENAGVDALLIDRRGNRDYQPSINNLKELRDKLR